MTKNFLPKIIIAAVIITTTLHSMEPSQDLGPQAQQMQLKLPLLPVLTRKESGIKVASALLQHHVNAPETTPLLQKKDSKKQTDVRDYLIPDLLRIVAEYVGQEWKMETTLKHSAGPIITAYFDDDRTITAIADCFLPMMFSYTGVTYDLENNRIREEGGINIDINSIITDKAAETEVKHLLKAQEQSSLKIVLLSPDEQKMLAVSKNGIVYIWKKSSALQNYLLKQDIPVKEKNKEEDPQCCCCTCSVEP